MCGGDIYSPVGQFLQLCLHVMDSQTNELVLFGTIQMCYPLKCGVIVRAQDVVAFVLDTSGGHQFYISRMEDLRCRYQVNFFGFYCQKRNAGHWGIMVGHHDSCR